MPLPSGEDAWLAYALNVVPAFVASEGAVIWAEVEAKLGESDWISANYDPSFPPTRGVQPHVLHHARQLLVADGTLVEAAASLSRRTVTAYLDGPGLAARRRTRILAAAAAKRRLYRTFLSWTGNADLCGHVAELIVDASIRALAGRSLWLPRDPSPPGQVRALLGRPITVGGPLDAAAFAAIDPNDPTQGFVPFAVEVKNVRSVIYAWSHETWDLLAKLGDFPEVVPILVARRFHVTAFRLFKDLGALGHATRSQWFHSPDTTRASIDAATFLAARSTFGFYDAVMVSDPTQPHASVQTFFSQTMPKVVDGRPLIAAQARAMESGGSNRPALPRPSRRVGHWRRPDRTHDRLCARHR